MLASEVAAHRLESSSPPAMEGKSVVMLALGIGIGSRAGGASASLRARGGGAGARNGGVKKITMMTQESR